MPRRTHVRGRRQLSKRRGLFLRGAVAPTSRNGVTQFGWERPGSHWWAEVNDLTGTRPPGLWSGRPTVTETYIAPDGKCQDRAFGKKGYLSEDKAKRKLRELQAFRRASKSAKSEREFYACPKPGCRYYHLSADGRTVKA
jgi:hypothetical protein